MPSSNGSFATPQRAPGRSRHGVQTQNRPRSLAASVCSAVRAGEWTCDQALHRLVARAAMCPASVREALAVLRAVDALAAIVARVPLTVCRAPRRRRPRCGARCRDGHPCAAAVVVQRTDEGVHYAARCRMHGGLSTGPRTPEGRRRALDALARGRAARWSRGSSAHEGDDQGAHQEAAGGSR